MIRLDGENSGARNHMGAASMNSGKGGIAAAGHGTDRRDGISTGINHFF
jgi:hypothetical protein